jgi:hypothetical protein
MYKASDWVGFFAPWADTTNPKEFFNEVMNDEKGTSYIHEFTRWVGAGLA